MYLRDRQLLVQRLFRTAVGSSNSKQHSHDKAE